MGQGVTIDCKSCGYIKTFWVGIGFMYSSLEKVINQVSPKRREMVLRISWLGVRVAPGALSIHI
jgi:hypothetical protein